MRIIPWSSRQRRFAANLQALAVHHPDAATLVGGLNVADFTLYQSPEGNYHLTPPGAPNTADAVPLQPQMANPAEVANLWPFNAKETPLPAPLAFDGCSHGLFLQHVAQTTTRTFLNYSCALYLLEPDPLAFAIALHIADLRDILASGRLRIFLGSDCLAAFETALENNLGWTLPQQVVTNPLFNRPPLGLNDRLVLLSNRRHDKRLALKAAIDAHYNALTPTHWRDIFATKKSLKVMGITSRFTTVLQYSMEELAAAARAAGHDFILAKEPDDFSAENPFLTIIHDHKPDLIVQLSRLRYENPLMPRGIPFLCWDQDNLNCMRTPEATANMDKLTFVAGHGAFHGFVYLGWPQQQCIFCQPAGAAHRYGSAVDAALAARYACDISYVSNASGSPEDLIAQFRPRYAREPVLAKLFDRVVERITQSGGSGEPWSGTRIGNLCITFEREAGIELAGNMRDEVVMNAVTVADRVFRHAVLRWAADFCDGAGRTLKLYGNGWHNHPRFSKYAAGPAAPGDEMRAIYHASKINLQIIETGFIHSRALDGLCAGAFFLTRRTPYDGLLTEDAAAHHRIAKHLAATPVASLHELANHPTLARDWQRVKPTLMFEADGRIHREPEVIRGIIAVADTPAASVAFPQFDEIAFDSQETFRERAARFLDNDAERRRIGDAMHKVALDKFSYDARWRQFLDHIRRSFEVQP